MNAELPDLGRAFFQARAFGRGADARLRGDPVGSCPYESGDLKSQWVKGWWDVENHWGESSRWPVPDPPPVRNLFDGIEE